MLGIETGPIAGGARLIGHGHDTPHLLVVGEGSLIERDGEGAHDMARNSFRLSAAGAAHELYFGSDGAECQVIEAGGRFWSRLFERALRRAARRNVFASAPGAALAGLESADALAASAQATATLGRMLAIAAGSPAAAAPAWFDEAADLIERDKSRPLHRLAGVLRRDRVHFTRAFGDWIGFRPSEYRTLRRAADALDLLRRDLAPLAEVALACGYAHQSHLTRTLKDVFGHPPSHWRRA